MAARFSVRVIPALLVFLSLLISTTAIDINTTAIEVSDGRCNIRIDPDTPIDTQVMTITLSCQAAGWVGLGFNKLPSMLGADIIVGTRSDEGDVAIVDR